ncbi:alpha beta-hydrolase [Trichoderma arundinaceum]|uniref:Alpha beta-hydrolase n=1 Tax=Trichoderma arundinaceum TaxID=490622 RepID=A0A395NNS0_TRIAR|nr:alpha beta-hydrolase [Trichoderma arundinaceum]
MSCPDCFRGAIHEGTPKGKEETIHDVLTYVATPETGTTSNSKIIFITDVFGFNLVNNKLLADKYATSTGCIVLMPSIIPGGGAPLSAIELFDSLSTPVGLLDLTGQAKRAGAAFRAATIFAPFAARTRHAFPKLLKFSRDVKSSLPADGKLGVAGFCWGGMHSTKLTMEPAEEKGSISLFDAHFVAHPAGLKVPDDFSAAASKFKVPISFAVGDLDMLLSKDKVDSVEYSLKEAFGGELSCFEVKTYSGCKHGFAVRADPKRTVEDEAATQAAVQAINWFMKYLI